METYQDLLNNEEIQEFTQTHQGALEGLSKAAKLLYRDPDAVRAMKKLFHAHGYKEIRVFLSYKSKDEEIAREVVDVLRKNSAGKLQVTFQAEFGEKYGGEKWRSKIHKEICKANWFILLFTDPSDDWDWCLYETGLFEAQLTRADRLICLHHGDSPPSPLEEYQAYQATRSELGKFLKLVFVEPNPVPGMAAINPALEDQVATLANNLEKAMKKRQQIFREIYEPWLELVIDNPGGLESKDDLDQAKIISANSRALDLFDFIEKPATLGELRQGLNGAGDDRWREELFHVVRKIATGRKFFTVQAVFQTRDNKFYRPIACAVDRAADNGPIQTFHITFTEEVTHGDFSAIPKELYVLGMIMRLTYRFRWEVLEKFSQGPLEEDDAGRLDNSMRRISIEAESRGISGEGVMADVVSLFPAEQQPIIVNMFSTWHEARNPQGTGTLDKAIIDKDVKKIPEILRQFIPVNQEFLELAADRFCELITSLHEQSGAKGGGVPASS